LESRQQTTQTKQTNKQTNAKLQVGPHLHCRDAHRHHQIVQRALFLHIVSNDSSRIFEQRQISFQKTGSGEEEDEEEQEQEQEQEEQEQDEEEQEQEEGRERERKRRKKKKKTRKKKEKNLSSCSALDLPTTVTCAPLDARFAAIACPIPFVPPKTSARLPTKSFDAAFISFFDRTTATKIARDVAAASKSAPLRIKC
jgi:hypothetical protein